MEIIALIALGRGAEQEAPLLAADLGLTAYETGVMLRAPLPIIVHRSDDRARTAEVLGKLRARGHDVVALSTDEVVSSDAMFRPKTFRLEGGDFVGIGQGETRRLPFADIFALLRATHLVQTEDSVVTREKTVSLGRAALTGGLVTSKTTEREKKRVTTEREPVLYVFRRDAAPWLLNAQAMLYEGLGREMTVSKAGNFDVLVRLLRELSPYAAYDARLLQVRVPTTIVASGAKHLTTSSAGTLDILAYVVAAALNRTSRPYR